MLWTQIAPVMDIDIEYEFTSHISGATVLIPLTLVPSHAKCIERLEPLQTLNNNNKNHQCSTGREDADWLVGIEDKCGELREGEGMRGREIQVWVPHCKCPSARLLGAS